MAEKFISLVRKVMILKDFPFSKKAKTRGWHFSHQESQLRGIRDEDEKWDMVAKWSLAYAFLRFS